MTRFRIIVVVSTLMLLWCCVAISVSKPWQPKAENAKSGGVPRLGESDR